LSSELHSRFQLNFAQHLRPPTSVGYSKHAHNKSKMADGAILEIRLPCVCNR